jgi:hypothetical protein
MALALAARNSSSAGRSARSSRRGRFCQGRRGRNRRRKGRRCRSKRPRGRSAEQRDELTSCYVEHGLPSGTRCASLQQAQDAPEAPAGPWGRLESF